MIKFDVFKDGRIKALTMSYDDGVKQDKRLIEIFDKYGIKGTFHINSGLTTNDGRLEISQIADTYKNHEVAIHGVYHYFLNQLSPQNIILEILDDRKALESITRNTSVK